MMTNKSLSKKLFQIIGIDVRLSHSKKKRQQIEFAETMQKNKWLAEFDFKTIIDIGANEGQFAQKARIVFPIANIISFEPIPAIYNLLKENFKSDIHFKAFNVGLGDKQEKIIFWLNEYSPSSSILRMDRHTKHFDFAIKQNQIEIQLEQLDTYAHYIDLSKPYLVKIDVQGYEDRVILGGPKIISGAQAIITEVSFISMYEGQVLFNHIYALLKAHGFKYVGNYEQLYSPVNNEILQADAIFVKEKLNVLS